ncbi:DUF1799 domain-containing protein [Gilvimarinus agarilyticus]|uniref:DUF1799 domain-containing protein n=1 Tax=Gilvimarinus agarilyticus TaxID=679259 RepID=UPI0005A13FA9
MQPANELIVRLFYAASTQWSYAGMSGTRTGLNYPAVETRASKNPDYAGLALEHQELVWDGLQRMEVAALKQWQSEAK